MRSRLFSTTACALALGALALAVPLALSGVGHAAAQDGRSLAPFVPTPNDVVERMLTLAGVTEDDVVYDLGCGDGRIVIAAAREFGARGVGVDIDPQRIAEANANAEQAGVQHLVRFIEQDAMQVDVSDATVVTLYLLSSSNARLRPILTRQLSDAVTGASSLRRPGSSERAGSAWTSIRNVSRRRMRTRSRPACSTWSDSSSRTPCRSTCPTRPS
jgi:hypothetical protein